MMMRPKLMLSLVVSTILGAGIPAVLDGEKLTFTMRLARLK